MKKLKRIILVLTLSLASVQCSVSEDEDPYPMENELRSLLLFSQYKGAEFYGSDFSRYPLIWMQQLSGVRGTHLNAENFNPDPANFNEPWQDFYQELLQHLLLMDYYSLELKAHVFTGIGNAMQAFFLGMFTDSWGSVPYTESLKYFGLGNNPVYDSQEDIYEAIFRILEEAIEFLEIPSDGTPVPRAADDLIYRGSIESWLKAARLMKLKFSLRLANKTGDYSESLALVERGGMFSSPEDDMRFQYSVFPELVNPWYHFDLNIGNTRMGENIVTMLRATEDPRLHRFVRLNIQNERIGAKPGSADFNASRIANSAGSIGDAASELTLLSFCEQKFMESEVYYRIGLQSNADEAYNDAVKASLQMFNARDIAWEEIHAARENVTLEEIIGAKYIALFLNPEVWTDWRRTGFPVLSHMPPANQNEDRVPRRFLYPAIEQSMNPENFPSDIGLNSRVWWDSDLD